MNKEMEKLIKSIDKDIEKIDKISNKVCTDCDEFTNDDIKRLNNKILLDTFDVIDDVIGDVEKILDKGLGI